MAEPEGYNEDVLGGEANGLSVPVELMFLGVLVIAAHVFQAIFQRFRVPDTLGLIGIGLLIGPVFGWVGPEDFGIVGEVLTSVALAVILFEAGLDLHLKEVRPALGGATGLVIVAYGLTALVVAGLVHWLAGLPWESAFFAGAVLAAPSPPVIIPMVQGLGFRPELRTTVTVESAMGEAAGLVIALGILRATRMGDMEAGPLIGGVLQAFVMAGIVGVLFGWLWAHALSWVRGLKNSRILTPSVIFIIFGLSEYMGFSGPIAALAFGMTMANVHTLPKALQKMKIGDETYNAVRQNEEETRFLADIVFLLKTFFFVYLGLSMHANDLLSPAAAGLVGVLVLTRLLATRLCLTKAIRSAREGLLLGCMVPRGLAAAVLAAAAAETPTLPRGGDIDNLIYAVILYSIVFTALAIIGIERWRPLERAGRWIFPDKAG